MKLTLPNKDLVVALSKVQNVVEKRSTNPILSAVLVQATESGFRLTATNKAMTYVGNFPAAVDGPGEVAIDAANALNVAKNLPAGLVTLTTGDNHAVTVKCERSKYNLSGLSAADFPPIPSFDVAASLTIDAANLRAVIDQTAFAIAPDDNRYGLNGAHLDVVATADGQALRMVGTDGNRLSWAQAPFSGKLTIGRRMLLPKQPLSELRKMIDGLTGAVEIGFGERAAVVRFEGAVLHMRLLEAEFPNYKDVLPTSFKRTVVVDRVPFLESLRRVSVFASDTSHSVKCAFTADGIVMTARKLDAGDSREELSCDMTGEPMTMGFNAQFIQAVAGVLTGGRIVLQMGDALSPCLVRDMDGENALHVVMPVRLD